MLPRTESSSQALNELLAFRRHGRNPSVRWINDERRLAVRLLALLPIGGRIDRDGLAILGQHFIVGLLLPLRLLLPLSEFLVCQKSSCTEAGGPLHRYVRYGRPLALQVRITPWRLGRGPCCLGLRGERHR